MKKTTIQRIKAVIEQVSEQLGVNLYQHAAATIKAMTGASDAEISKTFRAAKKAAIIGRLKPLPEPDPKKLDEMLHMLKSQPHVARDIYIEYAKKLPHAPGGRPRALNTPDAQAKLCARIAELLPACEDPQDAYRRAGAESRPPVSVWTARRYYREHLRSKTVSENQKPRRSQARRRSPRRESQ
jgi:hypothetical protein